MFDLSKLVVPVALSVMREGDTVCVSSYVGIPEGALGEKVYEKIIADAVLLAAQYEVGLIVDGGNNG